jgi:hypothetical protein
MNVLKPAKADDVEAALAVEGDIREFVRREIAPARSKSGSEGGDESVRAENINGLIERAGRGSLKELDHLIADLQRVRDHLSGEADRIQRAVSKYVQSSDSTMETVKVMAENMIRWKNTGAEQPQR